MGMTYGAWEAYSGMDMAFGVRIPTGYGWRIEG